MPFAKGLLYSMQQMNRSSRSFRKLGPGVLRLGGFAVDQSVWTPNGPGQTPGQVAPNDVKALASFLRATGWRCLYGVNLGGVGPKPYVNGPFRAVTTPALTADEVAHAQHELGSSLLGIEIGNECDGYGNSWFRGTDWNLQTFESLWDRFRQAILERTPGVKITGPADGSNVNTWTVPFAQWATQQRISLLTQHYYRGDGHSPSSNAENLISPDPHLAGILSALRNAANGTGIPYRIAECNSYFNGGAAGASNTYASSLWVLDFLFTCASGGASGVNFHGGGNSGGYTPIADSGGYVVEARPEYHGMLFFTLAGQGTLYTTKLSAGPVSATAYAVKTSSGLNLVIVNKDPAQALQLTAQLPQTVRTANLLELTQRSENAGPHLTATSGVMIQGASVSADGSFASGAAYELHTNGSQLSFSVPALSAVLIRTT